MAPTDGVHAVLEAGDQRWLDVLRWGLVPWWSKDTPGRCPDDQRPCGDSLVQARLPEAFEKRRCIIPADGFYE